MSLWPHFLAHPVELRKIGTPCRVEENVRELCSVRRILWLVVTCSISLDISSSSVHHSCCIRLWNAPLFSVHGISLYLLLNVCCIDYGYNYYAPFNYMAAYDYYGYDTNMYNYYGGRYGGGNFYEQPSRGRAAGECFWHWFLPRDSMHPRF